MRTGKALLVSVTLNPTLDHVYVIDHLRMGDSNRVLRIETDAGGKGVNLSRVFHKLGGDTLATGFLGGGTGAHVKAVLDREGVPNQFVPIRAETRSSILLEGGQDLPTAFSEAGPLITNKEYKALLDQLKLLLPEAAWMTVGGAIPPGLPNDVFAELIAIGHHYGCKVLLDADGEALAEGIRAAPDLLKPNIHEAERLLGIQIQTWWDGLDAAVAIRERLKEANQRKHSKYNPVVIVSNGSKGAVMACSEALFVGRSPKVNPRSTVGSGDSMLAAYIWAEERGKTYEEALQWGLAAGAATATTSGSEIGSRTLILQLLKEAQTSRVEANPAAAPKETVPIVEAAAL